MKLLITASAILVTTFLGACSHFNSAKRTPASVIDPEYQNFQALTAEALTFRANAIEFAHQKKIETNSNISLTREEGELIRANGLRYLEIRKKLLTLMAREKMLFKFQNTVVLNPHKGTRYDMQFGIRKVQYLDPTDPQGQQLFFHLQMALSSALILMDNYLVAIQPFIQTNLAYVLNYDQRGVNEELQKISDSYVNVKQRQQIKEAIELVDQVMNWRRTEGIATGPEESDMYTLIQTSIWYLNVKKDETNTFRDNLRNAWERMTLTGKRNTRAISYGASMGFGNMVGLVATRKG